MARQSAPAIVRLLARGAAAAAARRLRALLLFRFDMYKFLARRLWSGAVFLDDYWALRAEQAEPTNYVMHNTRVSGAVRCTPQFWNASRTRQQYCLGRDSEI